jgi:hypothetical protein
MKKTQNKVKTGKKANTSQLVGWAAIARFLGQTPAVVQRWHESGMPIQHNGRRVSAAPEELTRWIGTETGETKPIHISSQEENLTADLKEGLAFVRKDRPTKK